MRSMIHKHLGVRGEGMILAGAIWLLMGVGVVVDVGAPDLHPGLFHPLLPLPMRVVLWVVPGAVAMATAPFDRASVVGLALLPIAPFLRFMSYAWAWGLEVVPGPPEGDETGWYSALWYLLMIAFVILLSHIPANVRTPLSGRTR